jgi:hypothetical protein
MFAVTSVVTLRSLRRDNFPFLRRHPHCAIRPSASSATSAPSGLDFAFRFSQRLCVSAVNSLWMGEPCGVGWNREGKA